MNADRLPQAIRAAIYLCLFAHFALAQTHHQPLVAVEGEELWSRRLTPRPIVHTELPPRSSAFDICMRVVVNTSGQVESAKPEYLNARDKWALGEAITAEKSQGFRPFMRHGIAVRAAFEDNVWIVPPVQWATPRVPFPAISNWDSLRIALSRTGC